MGGVEAALIIALRIAHSRDIQWPITLMAVLSAVLLAAGVLRHYWDIWIHCTVRGISFIFVGIDAAGDLFSLVSVLFQPKMEVLGLVIYGTELVLWLGVFACGGYFNLVPWIQGKLDRKKSDRSNTASPLPHGCGQVGPPAVGIAMHGLPSSTSVFRTPSAEISIARARVGNSRKSNGDDGSEIAAGGELVA
jgi:hypothetical protein